MFYYHGMQLLQKGSKGRAAAYVQAEKPSAKTEGFSAVIVLLSRLFQAVNAPHEKDLFCAVTHEKHVSVGIQQAQTIV